MLRCRQYNIMTNNNKEWMCIIHWSSPMPVNMLEGQMVSHVHEFLNLQNYLQRYISACCALLNYSICSTLHGLS